MLMIIVDTNVDQKQKINLTNKVTPLQELLARDMSRGEFLTTLGLGLVSLLGASSIIRFLTGYPGSKTSPDHHYCSTSQASRGYGSSPYGR